MVKRVQPEKPKIPRYQPPSPYEDNDDSSSEWDVEPTEPLMCESCGDEELCEDRTDVDNIEEKNFCNECERYKCDDCMGNGPDGPTWLSNPLVNQYPYAVDDLWFCVECVVKVLRKRVLAQKATGKYKRRKTFDV